MEEQTETAEDNRNIVATIKAESAEQNVMVYVMTAVSLAAMVAYAVYLTYKAGKVTSLVEAGAGTVKTLRQFFLHLWISFYHTNTDGHFCKTMDKSLFILFSNILPLAIDVKILPLSNLQVVSGCHSLGSTIRRLTMERLSQRSSREGGERLVQDPELHPEM